MGGKGKENTPFIKDIKFILYVIVITFIGIFNCIYKEYGRIIVENYIFVINLKDIEKVLAPKKIYIKIDF